MTDIKTEGTLQPLPRKELAQEIHANAVAKGFWDDPSLSTQHYITLIISELCEAVEAHRKGRYHYKETPSSKKVEEEIWADVRGYEEDYQVSTLGNVRSKDLQVWNGRGYYTKKGKILSPGIGGTGYRTVSLRGKTHKIARLVATAFLHPQEGENVVNHIDGDKLNDNLGNLEWTTHSGNTQHAYDANLRPTIGVLSYQERVEIAFTHKSGVGYRTLHKNNNYGVTASAIQRVCYDGERYTDSVEFELADAYIRILDLAEAKGWRLGGYRLAYRSGTETFTENIYGTIGVITKITEGHEFCHDIALCSIEGLAHSLGIDLLWHVRAKMSYNATRPRLHGKAY